MAILNIIKEGDPILRKTCRRIETVDARTRQLAADMLDTMHAANGVGLAGPQVGKLRRIVVVEVEEGKPYVMLNPEIIKCSGTQEGSEGCLSLPGKWGLVERPMKVTVRAMGLDGKIYTVDGEGLLARAFCHELDHLDGTLYVDKVSRMLDPDEVEA